MKAIVVTEYGEPEVMRVAEVAKPEASGSRVLVKVYAAGVNPVDTYLRSGNHAHAPKLPYTPGKDAAGVVEAIGENVKGLKVGDRVYTADSLSGTYAEYSLCEEKQLGLLPENVTFEQGAGVWTPYATSYRGCFEKAKIASGETILIHGASGGVGIAAIQWAKNAGLRIIGTASSEIGHDLAITNGAEQVFDHTKPDYLQEIKDFTGGKGVDVIIEMLANENLQKDFDVLAMFGRIVVIGNRGSLDFNPRLAMMKDATIYGTSLFNAPQSVRDEIHEEIFRGLNEGYLNPPVSRTFSLGEAPSAHHAVIEQKANGKIVLTVG